MATFSLRTHYVISAHYNRWATRKILGSISELSTKVKEGTGKSISFQDTGFQHPLFHNMKLPCSSVYNTLCHMYCADVLWLNRLKGQDISAEMSNLWSGSPNELKWQDFFGKMNFMPLPNTLEQSVSMEEEHKLAQRAFNNIQYALDDINNEWITVTRGLDATEVTKSLEYKDSVGLTMKRHRTALLTHVFNHASHHRAQIQTALSQNDQQVPSLDMTTFLLEWENIHGKAFKWE